MPQTLRQLDAELSHVLTAIIHELDGVAHSYMSCEEMHRVIDNMLAKGGVPKSPSVHLVRWMHIFATKPNFKTAQIREALMVKSLVAVLPDCFGLFNDSTAPECKMCADFEKCKVKCTKGANSNKAETTDERVTLAYPAGKGSLDREVIQDVLESKAGQISKILARGSKVVLVVDPTNSLRVLTPDATTSQEDTMATAKPDTKSKKAVIEEEEEEEVIPTPKKAKKPVIEEEEEEEVVAPKKKAKPAPVEEEEEEEAPAPKKAKKPAVEEEEEEEPAPTKKAKKEPKAKAPLNKAQQEFVDACKGELKDDKKLFKFAKELGVTWEKKEDARINRMLCVMACKKALATKKK